MGGDQARPSPFGRGLPARGILARQQAAPSAPARQPRHHRPARQGRRWEVSWGQRRARCCGPDHRCRLDRPAPRADAGWAGRCRGQRGVRPGSQPRPRGGRALRCCGVLRLAADAGSGVTRRGLGLHAAAGPCRAGCTCLERGRALYLEKPVARSLDHAGRIVAAAARAQAVCAVGYQWRAVDVVDDLRLALAGRTVGCLVGQSIGGTQSRSWFLDRAAGGGKLLERAATTSTWPASGRRGGSGPGRREHGSACPGPRRRHRRRGDDRAALRTGGVGTIVVAWTNDELPGSYWAEVITDSAALRLDLDPDFRLSGVSGGVPVAAASRTQPFERSVDRFVAAARAGDPDVVFSRPPRWPGRSRWPPQPKLDSSSAQAVLNDHGDARL